MEHQIKNCQNCKQNFVIEPDDLSFYTQISVPTPTFCPMCRLKRRLMWRNERTLYKRSCDLCKSAILGAYHPDSPYTVYCAKCWWSDGWDAGTHGKPYDFSRPFFEQFADLLKTVPRIALVETNNIDSQYCNYSIGNNRLYYSFASHYNEDSGYLQYCNKMRNSYDGLHVGNSDRTIGCNYCDRLYNSAYLTYAFDCSDCVLGYDLHNCTSCIGCVNLRNASYQIFNQQYSKEEYLKVKSEIFATNKTFDQAVETFNTFKKQYPAPESYQKKCIDSTGNDLEETKALRNCFSVKNAEDSKYVYINAVNIKNCMDVNNLAYDLIEFAYECQGVTASSNMKFCDASWNGDSFLTYCNLCFSSKEMFGCVGIRSGSYRILNQQYTKEEYEELLPKVIAHMKEMPYTDSHGKIHSYGEFFPAELSPFGYNESIIMQYFPLSKEEVLVAGYKWTERENVNYTPTFDIEKEYALDTINDELVKEVFPCRHFGSCKHQCPKAFRMNKDELAVYKQVGIPLPTLCPVCRHYERLHERGGYDIKNETCMCTGDHDGTNSYVNSGTHDHTNTPCGVEFPTVFTKDLHPIVYCRQCFQREVI